LKYYDFSAEKLLPLGQNRSSLGHFRFSRVYPRPRLSRAGEPISALSSREFLAQMSPVLSL